MEHRAIPKSSGRTAATAVHFQLPDSFFTESNVVAQGQCIKVNISIFAAVRADHPFSARRSPKDIRSVIWLSDPWPVYIIMAMGSTTSFAGNPSIKAVNMTPSSPINFPTGQGTLPYGPKGSSRLHLYGPGARLPVLPVRPQTWLLPARTMSCQRRI